LSTAARSASWRFVVSVSLRFGAQPGLPSIDSTRSPGCSCVAAAPARSTVSTRMSGWKTPCETSSAQMIAKAIRKFMKGPAKITVIRFQTGWR
jgi:hypothetical protein